MNWLFQNPNDFLVNILQIIPENSPLKKTEGSSQSSNTIYGRPPMEDDDEDDNEGIDFDFQLDSFTPLDVQANLTCQEQRRPNEHSAWRPSKPGVTDLTFVNATPLLVNAGVGRGKSKVYQTAARKGALNTDVKSKVLKEIRADKEIGQSNYSSSWNYVRSDPRCGDRDSADNSSDENDEIYIGGLSSDGTDKQGNQNKEMCVRQNTCWTDDSLLDQLHKNNPKLPRHLLQRAIRMHSESVSGAYMSHFESQNSKWLRVSKIEIKFVR